MITPIQGLGIEVSPDDIQRAFETKVNDRVTTQYRSELERYLSALEKDGLDLEGVRRREWSLLERDLLATAIVQKTIEPTEDSLEVFHKEMFGPDSIASISIDDLHFLIKARNAFWELRKKVEKNKMASKMGKIKKTFGRSLAPKYDIPKNKIISEKDLTLKKPGTGILYENLNKVIGKRAIRAISKKELIQWEDLKNDNK